MDSPPENSEANDTATVMPSSAPSSVASVPTLPSSSGANGRRGDGTGKSARRTATSNGRTIQAAQGVTTAKRSPTALTPLLLA